MITIDQAIELADAKTEVFIFRKYQYGTGVIMSGIIDDILVDREESLVKGESSIEEFTVIIANQKVVSGNDIDLGNQRIHYDLDNIYINLESAKVGLLESLDSNIKSNVSELISLIEQYEHLKIIFGLED